MADGGRFFTKQTSDPAPSSFVLPPPPTIYIYPPIYLNTHTPACMSPALSSLPIIRLGKKREKRKNGDKYKHIHKSKKGPFHKRTKKKDDDQLLFPPFLYLLFSCSHLSIHISFFFGFNILRGHVSLVSPTSSCHRIRYQCMLRQLLATVLLSSGLSLTLSIIRPKKKEEKRRKKATPTQCHHHYHHLTSTLPPTHVFFSLPLFTNILILSPE